MPREPDLERMCDDIERDDEWRAMPTVTTDKLFDDIEALHFEGDE